MSVTDKRKRFTFKFTVYSRKQRTVSQAHWTTFSVGHCMVIAKKCKINRKKIGLRELQQTLVNGMPTFELHDNLD